MYLYMCGAVAKPELPVKDLKEEKTVLQDWKSVQIQKFLLASTCQTRNVAKTIKATKEGLKRDND